MESLLRWGITNTPANEEGSASTSTGATPRKDLDPAIIDHILGKPDAELMKEALANAQDESLSDDARVQALDDLEMLVENIDNASDLERLQMWQPIHAFLSAPSASDEIKTQALWVIGTAVQNNPAAQRAYLTLNPSPLPAIIDFLHPSVRSPALRSKAVYTLSSLLKHNRAAVRALDAAGGWPILRTALQDSNIAVRRKLAFLLNTLIVPSNPPSSTSTSTASDTPASTVVAPSDTAPTDSSPNFHGGTNAPPVHANSHASMLAEPDSTATAEIVLNAFREHQILPVLVRELATPTPHGPDGEAESDLDLEEKLVRLLHTYASDHAAEFSNEDKAALRTFFETRGADTHGLDESEKRELVSAIA